MGDPVLDDVRAAMNSSPTGDSVLSDVRRSMGMPETPTQQPNAIAAGLRAGVREAGGLTGAAASAVGKFSGLEGLEQWGAQTAQEQFAKAREVGRPDLETAPWHEGGAGWLPWLGYQAAKQVPQIATGVAAGMLVPEAAVPAALARAGAALPEFLGGGTIKQATTEAAREAAMQTGRGLAKQAIGQEVAGLPAAAGSMYQEAMDRPGGPTKEDAARALGMAPFYSALDAAAPAVEVSRLAKGLTGNLAKRVATGIATDAVMEMPQEAAQTAMELSFRPDLSTADKASQIVDAALTGGAVGGVFGGVSSIRGTKNIPPSQFSTEQILDSVNRDLGPMPAAPAAAQTEAAAPTVEGAVTAAPTETAVPETPAEPAAKEQAAAAQERSQKLHASIAATMEGGEIGQNTKQVKKVLGDVQTLPDAINKFFDIQDQADQRKGKAAGVLTPAQQQIGNALGIVSRDGKPLDIDAEIDSLTQRLTTAQTPAARQQITDQIDRLDLLRPIVAEVRAARQSEAPIETAPAPTPEEMITPPGVAPQAAPTQDTTGLAGMGGGLASGITDNMYAAMWSKVQAGETNEAGAPSPLLQAAKMVRDNGGLQTPEQFRTMAADYANIARGPDFQKEMRALVVRHLPEIGATTETPSAVQEPTPQLSAEAEDLLAKGGVPFKVTQNLTKIAKEHGIEVRGTGGAEAQRIVEQLQAMKAAQTMETPSAIQEPSPAGVYVQPTAETGRAVVEGNAQRGEAPGARVEAAPEVQAEITAAPEKVTPTPKVGFNTETNQIQLGAYKIGVNAQDAVEFRGPDGKVTNFYPNDAKFQDRGNEARLADMDAKGVPKLLQPYLQGYLNGTMSPQDIVQDIQQKLAKEQPAPAPVSPAAQTFMQQQGIKRLSPEERAAARERQKAEEQAYLARREKQVRQATVRNMGRGGVTAAPAAPKGMTPEEFLARRNRERPAMGLPGEESELDRDVSSLVENNASGKQVLDFLGQNGKTEFDRLYAQHLSRLGVSPTMQFADVNDPNLQIDREAAADRTIYGSYNVEQDRINLYERANSAQIALHEATHAATDRAIRTNSPSAQKLKDVFTEFAARPEKYAQATPAYDNESEFISEAFSNPDFREFLKTQQVGPKNLWEKFKDAVFKLLRMPQRARTVFDQVMEVGEPLFRENQQTTMEDVYRAAGEQELQESPMSIDKVFRGISKKLDDILEKAPGRSTAVETARTTVLPWNSITHMQAVYGPLFTTTDPKTKEKTDWIQKYIDHQQMTSSVAAKMSQLFKTVNDSYLEFEKSNPSEAETIRKLMRLTEFNVDWRKTWAEQTWLLNRANTEDVKRLYNDMRREGSRLSPEAKKLFDQLESVNNVTRYSQLSLSLYQMIVADPAVAAGVAGSDIDPMYDYMHRKAMHDDPAAAQKYWKETLERQIAAVEPFLAAQKKIIRDKTRTGAYVHTLTERKKAESIHDPLKGLIDSTKATMQTMEQSPNFHLGRIGNYFVTFKIKMAGKEADPNAQSRVARALELADVEAQISPESTNPTVFIRVETQEQAEAIRQLAVQMKDRGWLDAESSPKAGMRADSQFRDIMNPQWLQKYIEMLGAESGADAELEGVDAAAAAKTRDEMISRARELYLNMLPDNALAKVLTERKSIPGYSPDMMRSFAFRHQIGVNAVSNLATMHSIANDLKEMRGIIRGGMTGPTDVTVKRQNVFGEISQREAERSVRPQVSFWDSLRALNNAYFLASPAYVLTNLTQPGVLVWPELSKNHGFVKSAKALANTTGDAFKIMKAVMLTGRSADAIITEKALEASGVDERTAEFVMRVANSGNLDLGGVTRELARVVEGEATSATNRALRWAGAAGYYSETFTRLSAALAARELHEGKYGAGNPEKTLAYANKTINEAMLNYSTWNTARKMGKMGAAGEYTPVMFSFMTYQAQVFEKMYREMHAAFGGSKEAQTFLLGHLAAVTTLAGTLGLPFASVAARVFDALKDGFGDDDEPSDFKSAWRNFLADTFGKEMGEVLSRGVPRALGFDLSSRTTEADLMPLSRFLTDRREWREVAKDSALRTLGSPVSMILNILDGADKAANGNFLEGLQEMVPNGIKGPIAAYKMSRDGRYVDSQGHELPMEPGALDILYQVLNFTPQEKAEYQESRMAQTVRRGILTREAANLRDQLADAIMENSPDRAELMQRAQAFDRAHPDKPILKTIASTIRRRREGLAQAKATGLPLGVSVKDVGARGLTSYMNVDMQ